MRALLLLALLVPVCAFAAPATPPRLLVISAPSSSHESYRTQAALLLPSWAGLRERDVAVQVHFGAPAFSVTLVGRDGGEKLQRSAPVSPEELFALIDSMPMRRAEVRERS